MKLPTSWTWSGFASSHWRNKPSKSAMKLQNERAVAPSDYTYILAYLRDSTVAHLKTGLTQPHRYIPFPRSSVREISNLENTRLRVIFVSHFYSSIFLCELYFVYLERTTIYMRVCRSRQHAAQEATRAE